MRAQKSLLLWLAVGLVLSVGIAPQPARADAALPDKFLYAIAYTAPAGEFDQPEAVAVGADGVVYVADTGNHRIQRFTAEGELLGLWGSWGEGEGQFDSPTGLTVAPDGTVWVADSGNDRIQHFTAEGRFIEAWGGPGDAEGEFAAPMGVAVGADGVVYVADTNNNRIQRFDADGDPLGSWTGWWGEDGAGDAEWNDFSGPEGVAVGPDGSVYVSNTRDESLLRLTATGVFLDSATDRSAYPWRWPEGSVTISPDGTLYVPSIYYDQIKVYSTSNSGLDYLRRFGEHGYAGGQFENPESAAMGPDGSLYVADTGNNRIQRLDPATGELLNIWGSRPPEALYHNGVESVDVAPDGSVYFADTWKSRIRHYSATGDLLGEWGSWGNDTDEFNGVTGIAVAPDGTVFVSDAHNNRVRRFTGDGEFLGTIGEGQLRDPRGLDVGFDGTLYVADRNSAIEQFSSTGQHTGTWGAPEPFYFEELPDVAVAPDGSVYCVDSDADMIYHYAASGSYLGGWAAPSPFSIAIATDGSVYVSSHWMRHIQHYSDAGELLDQWGREGADAGQFDVPTSIAVGADGSVYVTESVNRRIQRFSADGAFLGQFGQGFTDAGRFDDIKGYVTASDGSLYVVDIGGGRVQHLSAEGEFLGKWGHPTDGYWRPVAVALAPDGSVYVSDTLRRIEHFSFSGEWLNGWEMEGAAGPPRPPAMEPASLAVGPDGTVYVADRYLHLLHRYTAAGDFLGYLDSGVESDDCWHPFRLAVGNGGSLYVSDFSCDRVQHFSAAGEFLGAWGAEGVEAGQFQSPVGVDIAPDGSVVVADLDNRRVQFFDAAGQFIGMFSNPGTGPGEFNRPSELTVAPNGALYLSDGPERPIQVFAASHPASWRAECYANPHLAGAPALVTHIPTETLALDWGAGAPGAALPEDGFSARYTRVISFPAGLYRFTLAADDGARLWAGDRLLVDEWQAGGGSFSATIWLAGESRVQVETYDESGGAALSLGWTSDSPTPIPTIPGPTATPHPYLWLPMAIK